MVRLDISEGRAAVAAVVGGVVAVGTVPVALSAMGFTSVGIAASSIAAKMMSTAAIANGGGVAAGSLVAILQSVGECSGQDDQSQEMIQPRG
uniref:Interferon alpha inducible protein 27 like 1 n=1 Tax=Gorilla gorilla gorilla TaxID=9595 RepID=G3S9W4_GORGO